MPPEAATLDPPSAPAISVPPTPPPSSSPSISVTPAAIDKGPVSAAPRTGSAKERMFNDLRKKAGADEVTPPVTPPVTSPKIEADKAPEWEGEPPPVDEDGKVTTPPVVPDKKGKVSPWKLVDEHKAARLKAETELSELRKTLPDPIKFKEVEERAKTLEARAKELEDEIRFTNFSKSQEFKEKYQKPYEESWKRWMGELGELVIQDAASGEERPLTPSDILDLVNMPLQKAREQADAQFGSFANDVMLARKEIRGLYENQNKALAEAKTSGAERETKMQQAARESHEVLSKEITTHWTKANEMAKADEKFGKFFTPIEGDTEGNTRLTKGFEIADKAFSVNPLNPNLTSGQREQVVQLHSAVRNRAAAFGRLSYQNDKLSAELAALKEEFGKFKSLQPGAGDGQREKVQPVHSSAKDSVLSALRNIAH